MYHQNNHIVLTNPGNGWIKRLYLSGPAGRTYSVESEVTGFTVSYNMGSGSVILKVFGTYNVNDPILRIEQFVAYDGDPNTRFGDLLKVTI